EVAAWCLTNGYDIQKFVCMLGPGNNGKSTFAAILREFLGGLGNVSSLSMAELADDKFKASLMYGKIANVSAEGGGTKVREQARILSLTGGDSVNWERKYGQPWDAVNTTKQIFASNWLPFIERLTNAWLRRFTPVLFTHEFSDDDPKYTRRPQSEILALARKEFPGLL